MKWIFLLSFFFLIFPAAAQKYYNRFGIIDKAYYANGYYVKLNVLSILDFGLPTIQPGIEYKLNDRLGFEFDAGIPLNNLYSKRETDSTFFHFYKLKATVKYYTSGNDYWALETFLVHARYSRYYDRYILQSGGYGTSYYTVNNKNVEGFDIKYGKAIELGGKWYLENFIGAGFRIVTITQPVNINPQAGYPPHYAFSFYDKIGTKFTPHVVLGMQLVYKL